MSCHCFATIGLFLVVAIAALFVGFVAGLGVDASRWAFAHKGSFAASFAGRAIFVFEASDALTAGFVADLHVGIFVAIGVFFAADGFDAFGGAGSRIALGFGSFACAIGISGTFGSFGRILTEFAAHRADAFGICFGALGVIGTEGTADILDRMAARASDVWLFAFGCVAGAALEGLIAGITRIAGDTRRRTIRETFADLRIAHFAGTAIRIRRTSRFTATFSRRGIACLTALAIIVGFT